MWSNVQPIAQLQAVNHGSITERRDRPQSSLVTRYPSICRAKISLEYGFGFDELGRTIKAHVYDIWCAGFDDVSLETFPILKSWTIVGMERQSRFDFGHQRYYLVDLSNVFSVNLCRNPGSLVYHLKAY